MRNLYALLLKLISELAWFTVLDLKDAFCLSLASVSLFLRLNGKNDSRRKTQLTWTVPSQGFKNSPTLLGNQLVKDLEQWEHPPGKGVLLHVADLLIATSEKEH